VPVGGVPVGGVPVGGVPVGLELEMEDQMNIIHTFISLDLDSIANFFYIRTKNLHLKANKLINC
jgi:hypothetical protein